MSVMVKRFFIFGMLFGIFFASCSYNSGSNLTTSCSIEVDKDFVSGMRSVLQKSYSDTTQVRVNIECTGGYETSKWYDATIGTLPGVVFSFEEVPFDKTFSIYVGVYKGSELIYEASQKDIVITRTNPSFELSVLLKKLLNTDYVMYEHDSDFYNFYLKNTATASVSGNADFQALGNNFCFDKDGYFYCIDREYQPLVFSNNKDFDADGISLGLDENIDVLSFTIDRFTGYLYLLGMNDATGELIGFVYPSLISSRIISDKKSFSINCTDASPIENVPKFAVNKGILYVALAGGESYRNNPVLMTADLNGLNNGETAQGEVVMNFGDYAHLSQNAAVSDVLYQDGGVYILGIDKVDYPQTSQDEGESQSTAKLYSRGLLLKYDTASGTGSSLGFSEEVKKNTDMGTSGLYTYISNSQLFVDNAYTKALVLPSIIAYTDTEPQPPEDKELDITEHFPSLYTPAPLATSLSNSCFYGAEKFIAIKPKKLVIADDGFAFYTASDGGIKFKNVNRVITVDLEKFAISSIENAKTSFASEFEKFYLEDFDNMTDSTYKDAFKAFAPDGKAYYLDSEMPEDTEFDDRNVSLAIPCGD